jgi:hypothetical protein
MASNTAMTASDTINSRIVKPAARAGRFAER